MNVKRVVVEKQQFWEWTLPFIRIEQALNRSSSERVHWLISSFIQNRYTSLSNFYLNSELEDEYNSRSSNMFKSSTMTIPTSTTAIDHAEYNKTN